MGFPTRKVLRRAVLLAVSAAFLTAQSGLAASLLDRAGCDMDESSSVSHASMMVMHECCGGMAPMEACEHVDAMPQAGSTCCRVQQEHGVPSQGASARTDRTDVTTPRPRPSRLAEAPAQSSPPPLLPAHLFPVLDRKADLRV